MSFSRTHREIRQMIRASLLQTTMARAIFRKGLGLIGGQPSTIPVDLSGQYAHVDILEGGYSPFGSFVTYGAEIPPWEPATDPKGAPTRYQLTDFLFPDGTQRASHKGDWRGIHEVRLLATVTSAGPLNSALYLELWIDTDPDISGPDPFDPAEIPFSGGSPTIALDEVGLHVTDWHRIDWGEYRPLDPYELDLFDDPAPWPAQIYMRVSNPDSSTGSVGIGLCQIQVRGDLDVL